MHKQGCICHTHVYTQAHTTHVLTHTKPVAVRSHSLVDLVVFMATLDVKVGGAINLECFGQYPCWLSV